MVMPVILGGITHALNLNSWGRAGRLLASCSVPLLSNIHTSTSQRTIGKWEKKNRIVYPPQKPEESRRPARAEEGTYVVHACDEAEYLVTFDVPHTALNRGQEIYHCRREIKYSMDKMWYLAKMIRGMNIDEALAQLEFNDKKGAKVIKEVLLEAQEMAVRKHNVEFKSNLHIAQSFSGKGHYLKRIRYHGKGMFGIMDKVKCHYFVKLVEGPPPPPEAPKTGFDQAKEYVQQLRNRTIINTL